METLKFVLELEARLAIFLNAKVSVVVISPLYLLIDICRNKLLSQPLPLKGSFFACFYERLGY